MKVKRIDRKLSLSRETLRNLSEDELREVPGGVTTLLLLMKALAV
jgi:hypothetical protein